MKRAIMAACAVWLLAGSVARAGEASNPLASADGVVHELYRLISVDVGESTDWEAVRSLFLPEAIIVLRVSNDANQTFSVQGWIDDFIAYNERAKVSEHGFSETIVKTDVTVFRDIANVFVLYEAKLNDWKRPPSRGVDSIDLVRRDGRWWIASIVNDLPGDQHPLPPRLAD
jgi:hypothetical protein